MHTKPWVNNSSTWRSVSLVSPLLHSPVHVGPLDRPLTVNNVGRSHDMPVYFDQTPQQEVDDILQINIHGTLAITKLILPFMLAKYALPILLTCDLLLILASRSGRTG